MMIQFYRQPKSAQKAFDAATQEAMRELVNFWSVYLECARWMK